MAVIGRRVTVAGLAGIIHCRYTLTVRPQWVVVLDGGGVLIVRDDELEDGS